MYSYLSPWSDKTEFANVDLDNGSLGDDAQGRVHGTAGVLLHADYR